MVRMFPGGMLVFLILFFTLMTIPSQAQYRLYLENFSGQNNKGIYGPSMVPASSSWTDRTEEPVSTGELGLLPTLIIILQSGQTILPTIQIFITGTGA